MLSWGVVVVVCGGRGGRGVTREEVKVEAAASAGVWIPLVQKKKEKKGRPDLPDLI